MLEALQVPLVVSLIAAFVTTLGLVAVAFSRDWSMRNANVFAMTAAGLLLAMAILHILPEAFSMSRYASLWLLFGYFIGFSIKYVGQIFFNDGDKGLIPVGAIAPVFAISCHSFFDGIIYSITFAVDFTIGVNAAAGLVLHKLPEGIAVYAILRANRVTNRMAFSWAVFAAGATTPLGVLVSGPVIYTLDQGMLGALFAISAGLILYVATGPLMNPVNEVRPTRALGAVMAGISVATVIYFAPIPGHHHSHVHADSHVGHNHTYP